MRSYRPLFFALILTIFALFESANAEEGPFESLVGTYFASSLDIPQLISINLQDGHLIGTQVEGRAVYSLFKIPIFELKNWISGSETKDFWPLPGSVDREYNWHVDISEQPDQTHLGSVKYVTGFGKMKNKDLNRETWSITVAAPESENAWETSNTSDLGAILTLDFERFEMRRTFIIAGPWVPSKKTRTAKFWAERISSEPLTAPQLNSIAKLQPNFIVRPTRTFVASEAEAGATDLDWVITQEGRFAGKDPNETLLDAYLKVTGNDGHSPCDDALR